MAAACRASDAVRPRLHRRPARNRRQPAGPTGSHSAQALLDGVGADAGVEGLAAAVQAAEAEMAPIGEAARKYRIHCVGHGHIDMNWMWSWPETVATTHDTFASVLSLMEQYPDLTYSQSQASVYALVGALLSRHVRARSRSACKEGRWEVTRGPLGGGRQEPGLGRIALPASALHARLLPARSSA